MKKILDFVFQVKDTTHAHKHHDTDHHQPHIIIDYTGNPLDVELQRYIAAGAPLSLTNYFPVNSIDPKQDKEHMEDWLGDFWSIYTLEDLEYQLTSLYLDGHSIIFNLLLQHISGYTSETRASKVIEILDERMNQDGEFVVDTEYDSILEFSQNIDQAVAFIMGHFAPITKYPKDIRTDAYDIDRIVTISRVAYGAGLFTAELAEQNIRWAGASAPAIYNSWREFAMGYLLGRAIWGGVANDDFLHRVKIVDLLLKDPASPWNTLGWISENPQPLFTADISKM